MDMQGEGHMTHKVDTGYWYCQAVCCSILISKQDVVLQIKSVDL